MPSDAKMEYSGWRGDSVFRNTSCVHEDEFYS